MYENTMNNMNYNMNNPYNLPRQNTNPYYQNQIPSGPRQEVVRVNGEQGANLYPIGPNSSALLLDVSGKLVWLVTTDGAGFKTVMAYDVMPHQMPPEPNYDDLNSRIARLEEIINGLANATNAGNTSTVERQSDTPTTTATTNQSPISQF